MKRRDEQWRLEEETKAGVEAERDGDTSTGKGAGREKVSKSGGAEVERGKNFKAGREAGVERGKDSKGGRGAGAERGEDTRAGAEVEREEEQAGAKRQKDSITD